MPALLRSLLRDGESRMAVSAYDALTARIAETAGFEIIHLSGFAASAAIVGVPDIGLMTMTEMVEACRRICETVSVPVIADADTGYGNALAVRRTVQAFEATGAAGLHLEDQVSPKRCGHMVGKQVIAPDEMAKKIQAAVDARRDPDFVIVARTDASAVEGLPAALDRARRYREAGADVLFVEAPTSEAEIRQIASELEAPLLFNWSYDGLTPHVSRNFLTELGYNLILFPDVASVVHRSLTEFEQRLAKAESLDELHTVMTPFAEFNDFVGLSRWREMEKRYV